MPWLTTLVMAFQFAVILLVLGITGFALYLQWRDDDSGSSPAASDAPAARAATTGRMSGMTR